MDMDRDGYGDHGFGWHGHALHGYGWQSIAMTLIMAVVVGGIVYLITRLVSSRSNKAPTPREVLEMRLAKGEVTKEQYVEARDLLSNG